MIKFLCNRPNGRTLIGLGISRGNVKRLLQGDPIHINLEDLGLTWRGEIEIFFGETEEDLKAALEPMIDERTIVHGTFERKKPS